MAYGGLLGLGGSAEDLKDPTDPLLANEALKAGWTDIQHGSITADVCKFEKGENVHLNLSFEVKNDLSLK